MLLTLVTEYSIVWKYSRADLLKHLVLLLVVNSITISNIRVIVIRK